MRDCVTEELVSSLVQLNDGATSERESNQTEKTDVCLVECLLQVASDARNQNFIALVENGSGLI